MIYIPTTSKSSFQLPKLCAENNEMASVDANYNRTDPFHGIGKNIEGSKADSRG